MTAYSWDQLQVSHTPDVIPTPADIARGETESGVRLRASYVDFVSRFGGWVAGAGAFREPRFAEAVFAINVDRLSTGASRWSSPGHPVATCATHMARPPCRAYHNVISSRNRHFAITGRFHGSSLD